MSMRSSNVQTWNAWPGLESPRWNLATLLAILVAGERWLRAGISPRSSPVCSSAQGRRHIWAFLTGLFPPELSATFLRLLIVPTIETIKFRSWARRWPSWWGFRWRFWLRIVCVSPASSTRWMGTVPAGAV